mgnify:FL=1|jgi:hypothetical protein
MADQFENQLPQKSDAKWVRALDASGNPILISKEDLASVVGGLIPTASPNQRGLHPSAKFQQSDNNAVNEINNINILSTDIYYGDLTGDGAKIYIIKTYPASPAYMYQEAICMYPLTRYWRAKVDGTWRSWIKM